MTTACADALTSAPTRCGGVSSRASNASVSIGSDIVYVHDPDDHVEAAITQAIPALIALRDEESSARSGLA